jgi:hypothetical protein
MPHSFKLSRRIARFRAPLCIALGLALVGCDSNDSLNGDSSTDPGAVGPGGTIEEQTPLIENDDEPFIEEPTAADAASDAEAVNEAPLAAIAFAGGIPIGPSATPITDFGARYNGSLLVIWPGELMSKLSAIKARGGKIVLSMVGSDIYYKDGSGHFSFDKWKARVDRYKGTDFSSYVNDGTILGHFLLDEPQDPTNWNGRPLSQSQVEAMAQYSKQRWPNMPTIIRAEPGWLDNYSGSYRYLDAGWAQYTARRGDPSNFLNQEVARAKSKGLALIVGLNLIHGGEGGRAMTASQVKSWGSEMLSNTYSCAFISWKYQSTYLSSASMKDAMNALRNKAENRSFRSCRGS